MKSHGFNRLTASKKAVNAQRGNRPDYYEAEVEDVSSDDSVLNLMEDIEELSNAYPMTDSNNTVLDQYVKVDKVIGISDLEDISDGDLLDVDAESDEVNRSEFKDVSEGVLKQDTNGNEFVMVEYGISLDYNDDGGISDDSVINDEMSDCDNVDNDGDGNSDGKVISVERKDGKNTDNDDEEMSDDSVNSDEISDGENWIMILVKLVMIV